MNGKNRFYFQFKPNIYRAQGQAVILKDVIELTGPPEIVDNILDTVIIPSRNIEPVVITAMDVIRTILSFQPDAEIFLVGEGKTLIEIAAPKSGFNSKIITWIKLGISLILTFIGAGLAIMYFHKDVDMHEVHKTIFSVITGKNSEQPYIISIPYSIGIGIGIALFFDVFSFGRKKNNPGPLELELYNYEKDVYSYIRDEEEKEEGS